MLKRLRNKNREEEGQGLVEFALVVPILITILCGILDYGWIYSQKYEVEHAAFEGARYASIYGAEINADDVKTRVKELLPDADVVVEVAGNDVSVTVTRKIPLFTFVASTFYGPDYTAKSKIVMALN